MWYKVAETSLPVRVRLEIKRPNGSTMYGVFTEDAKFITDSLVTLEINLKWEWRIPMND